MSTTSKLRQSDAEVMAAIDRLAARVPVGSTVVTVRRATGSESPAVLAAVRQMRATDDAVCFFCRSKCWWTAAARNSPGPHAPICIDCITAELKKLRAEGERVEAVLVTDGKRH